LSKKMKLAKINVALLPFITKELGKSAERNQVNTCASGLNPFYSSDTFDYANIAQGKPSACFRTTTRAGVDKILHNTINQVASGRDASIFRYPPCEDHFLRVQHVCRESLQGELHALPVKYPPEVQINEGLGWPVAVFVDKARMNEHNVQPSDVDHMCMSLVRTVSGTHPVHQYTHFYRELYAIHGPLYDEMLETLPLNVQKNQNADRAKIYSVLRNRKIENIPVEVQKTFYRKYRKLEKTYTDYVERLASMDQSAFEERVKIWKIMQKLNYKSDYTTTKNEMVDFQKNVIGTMDASFHPAAGVDGPQSLSRLTEALLGDVDTRGDILTGGAKFTPWDVVHDPKQQERLAKGIRGVITKMQSAADKHQIPEKITIKSPLVGWKPE
jgi:hypothetical protein